MAISAQDKILYVANKLGLSTLKDMQGSTGAVYDVDTENSGVIFGNASKHQNPGLTNLNDNKFEVNEALLIETISFFAGGGISNNEATNLSFYTTSSEVILFDLIIGNKVVMKDTPVFAAGMPETFASEGVQVDVPGATAVRVPRHQVYLEGAGILIPPQVEWSINYKMYNMITGTVVALTDEFYHIGAYLFGTRVLLNFNTSI